MKNKKKMVLWIVLGVVVLCVAIYVALIILEANTPSEGGYGAIEIRDDGIAIAVLTEINGKSEVKLIRVSGLADPAAEELLNQQLYEFSTWSGFMQDAFGAEVEIPEIDYTIIGDYISVRCVDVIHWEDDESPTRYVRTQIFDLTTGEQAASPIIL